MAARACPRPWFTPRVERPEATGGEVAVALVGLGRMGRVHLDAIRAVPQLRLVAVAEPRREAVAEAAELIGSAAVHDDASGALRQPGLDACIVVTPTEAHAPVVAEALELGVHVFCEKPLTLDADTSLRLADAAASRGLSLQVGFWRRFARPFVEARRVLAAGTIGRPLLLRLVQWDADSPPAAWCDVRRSGGIFVDMGVHEFDEIEWLLGARIRAVRTVPLPLVDETLGAVGDLDNALVHVEVVGGAHAVVELSRNCRYGDDVRLEILGSEGAVLVETLPFPRVRVGDRTGLATVWEQPGVDAFRDGVASELAAFAAVVAGGDVAVPGADASVRATAVGEAARASAAAGEPRAVPHV